ncbi:26889_t:CDS:10 [Gigaspora margarita]|uniref:26889_t:CDS:1 n=1 Tax=Gigaspora margarita TaxID=4874 RepID=A0ABN7VF02_GIGMA|nr:26889_t:CDS:10 [Gigaspora margarita]
MKPGMLLEQLEQLAKRKMHKLKDLPEYALMIENLLKIAMILLRSCANIPVVCCGEAGCGKTSLISFLSMVIEVKFLVLNLHVGVHENNILTFMEKAMILTIEGETWIFFDKINTCDHIGMLGSLISHRLLNRKRIYPNIRLFAVCNPYRLRTKSQSNVGLVDLSKLYEEKGKLVYQIMVKTQLNHQYFAELLCALQEFICKVEELFSISLRDMKCAIKLFKFFKDTFNKFNYLHKNVYPDTLSKIDELKNRNHQYKDFFERIISQEQEYYFKHMQCPEGTAANEALLENLLIMIVCIQTRIPVFIIVYMIPYQGSGSSTSKEITKVFQTAQNYQQTSSKENPVTAVVLLDEVVLVETSPYNLLKVLHALLELPLGSQSSELAVPVIGISNWRLDNSKSSRALLVQWPLFAENDLVDTTKLLLGNNFKGIYSIDDFLKKLAKSYLEYINNQKHCNFYGLQDYYSLVKSIRSMKNKQEPNIQLALARNFRGAENMDELCTIYFRPVLKQFHKHRFDYIPIPVQKLIDANFEERNAQNLMLIGNSNSIVTLQAYRLCQKNIELVVIIGSQFPDDIDGGDYSYAILNQGNSSEESDKKNFTRISLGPYSNPMLYGKFNLVQPSRKKRLFGHLKEWTIQISNIIKSDSTKRLFNETDMFIGFSLEESLQSLIIDQCGKNPSLNDDAIIHACKEALISIATSDSIVRADKSYLKISNEQEVKHWQDFYFQDKQHSNIQHFYQVSLNNKSEKNLVIINTFSNINTDIKSCLQGIIECQIDKLSTFKSETKLQNQIKHFYESNNDLYIL